MMVFGLSMSVAEAITWEDTAVTRSDRVGPWKGLILETPYLIALQVNRNVIRLR